MEYSRSWYGIFQILVYTPPATNMRIPLFISRPKHHGDLEPSPNPRTVMITFGNKKKQVHASIASSLGPEVLREYRGNMASIVRAATLR